MGEQMTVVERVQLGAMLLDSTTPGWAGRIDPQSLVLNDCGLCILGQLFGDYREGRASLGLVSVCNGWSHGMTAAHGFYADEVSVTDARTHEEAEAIADREYDALAAAWLVEIRARLAVAATVVEPETATVG